MKSTTSAVLWSLKTVAIIMIMALCLLMASLWISLLRGGGGFSDVWKILFPGVARLIRVSSLEMFNCFIKVTCQMHDKDRKTYDELCVPTRGFWAHALHTLFCNSPFLNNVVCTTHWTGQLSELCQFTALTPSDNGICTIRIFIRCSHTGGLRVAHYLKHFPADIESCA
jgi:hypothetical protein